MSESNSNSINSTSKNKISRPFSKESEKNLKKSKGKSESDTALQFIKHLGNMKKIFKEVNKYLFRLRII